MFFLKFPCFLYDPVNVGNFISISSGFSKPRFYIWKFLIHVLLKSSLKDFDNSLARLWIVHNFMVVWTLLAVSLLSDLNEHCPFLVLWLPLHFPNLLMGWVQRFNSSIIFTSIQVNIVTLAKSAHKLKVKVKVTQLYQTFCDPRDYTVHGILQVRILEWVAFPFSRDSFQPSDQA